MSKSVKQAADGTETRSEWTTPRVVRMAAGDAENGPNPLGSDGAFSTS